MGILLFLISLKMDQFPQMLGIWDLGSNGKDFQNIFHWFRDFFFLLSLAYCMWKGEKYRRERLQKRIITNSLLDTGMLLKMLLLGGYYNITSSNLLTPKPKHPQNGLWVKFLSFKVRKNNLDLIYFLSNCSCSLPQVEKLKKLRKYTSFNKYIYIIPY